MKLYLLTYDGYESSYGSEIYCKGIFTNKDRAHEIANKQPRHCSVTEINVNEELKKGIYLGGYIE